MPSYVQVQLSDGSYAYVERGRERHREGGLDVHVQRDFEAFRSIVDGSLVSSRRDLAEHNRRHNVIHESELGSEKDREAYFGHKAKERNDFYNSTESTAYGRRLARERRAEILEAIKKHGG